ncbi:MAG TPA: hypothetical protein VF590_05205 [Isosphaeraceae bacterium]
MQTELTTWLERCIGRDRSMRTGLADELTAKAPRMRANLAALEGCEAAGTGGGRLDAEEAAGRLREAADFCHAIEAIGIVVMRAGGLEHDPARSRELMQQWFDLGSVQECLEGIRARWEALVHRAGTDAAGRPAPADGRRRLSLSGRSG